MSRTWSCTGTAWIPLIYLVLVVAVKRLRPLPQRETFLDGLSEQGHRPLSRDWPANACPTHGARDRTELLLGSLCLRDSSGTSGQDKPRSAVSALMMVERFDDDPAAARRTRTVLAFGPHSVHHCIWTPTPHEMDREGERSGPEDASHAALLQRRVSQTPQAVPPAPLSRVNPGCGWRRGMCALAAERIGSGLLSLEADGAGSSRDVELLALASRGFSRSRARLAMA